MLGNTHTKLTRLCRLLSEATNQKGFYAIFGDKDSMYR